MKKTISLLLSVIMLFGIVSTAGTAFAADNNSKSNAYLLSFGKPYEEKCSSKTDKDYFRFYLPTKTTIDLDFSFTQRNASGYWNVQLLNESKKIKSAMVYLNGSNYTFKSVNLSAGTYYVFITSSINMTDTYYLTVDFNDDNISYEKETNNAKSSANPLTLGKTTYGDSVTGNDDYYSFTMNKTGIAHIDFWSPAISSASGSWTVSFYSYQKKGCSRTVKLSSGGSSFPAIGLKRGEYYICVKPNSSDLATLKKYAYGITVNSSSQSNWEAEYNDTKGNANYLNLGDAINKSYTVYGNSINKSDYDYYKFSLNYEQKVELRMGSTAHWKAVLTKGSNFSKKITSNTKEMVLKKGTYYVKVAPKSSSSFNTDTYSLTIKTFPKDIDKLKAKRIAKGKKAKLTWTKTAGADGFQIKYGYSKKTLKTVYANKNAYQKTLKLKKGKKYTVKVRAYKYVDGKPYYTKWTKTTIKK